MLSTLAFCSRIAKLEHLQVKEALKLLFSRNEVNFTHTDIIAELCNGDHGR